MVWRQLLALLLVGVLGTLVPLAHATPPDPSWVAGLWDDGDHDDAVQAVLDTADAVDIAPAVTLDVIPTVTVPHTAAAAPAPATPPPPSYLGRAPPLA
jgi:hypothetical protein